MSTEEHVLPSEGTEVVQEAENDPEDVESPPPVVTRTRSGRTVRAPSALVDSQVGKTPIRRTRKSVVHELPGENLETEVNPVVPVSECTESVAPFTESAAPCTESAAPCTESQVTEESVEPAADMALLDTHHSHPTPMETAPERPDKTARKRSHSESNGKQNTAIPLGKPKSGRIWKDRNKQRFSALLRDKPLRTSWEKKMEAKREKELVKRFCVQLKDDKAKAKEDKRKRREENLKRRAENERKAEVVQVIRNTSKMKRMKKKQLRKIEKRDTLAMLQKTNPQNTKATGKGSKPQNKKATGKGPIKGSQ